LAYAVGILATVYHFANGLWNFLISWGITVGKKAQRVSGFICLTIGLALLAIGFSALGAFYFSDPNLKETPQCVQTAETKPTAQQVDKTDPNSAFGIADPAKAPIPVSISNNTQTNESSPNTAESPKATFSQLAPATQNTKPTESPPAPEKKP
jgi:hypothetical protein